MWYFQGAGQLSHQEIWLYALFLPPHFVRWLNCEESGFSSIEHLLHTFHQCCVKCQEGVRPFLSSLSKVMMIIIIRQLYWLLTAVVVNGTREFILYYLVQILSNQRILLSRMRILIALKVRMRRFHLQQPRMRYKICADYLRTPIRILTTSLVYISQSYYPRATRQTNHR